MASPVIAWLTDFGTRDHYVGTMKAVALSIVPEATFIDITHEIEPQDVPGGALELAASYRFFPVGTVFVAVVDPGVGSLRHAIAVKAGGYTFVGPDNGLLTPAVRDIGPHTAVVLSEARFALPVVSRTFEGRDRFAPAAAWLARGQALETLGQVLSELAECAIPQPRLTPEQLQGEVIRVDRFGNAVTNITRGVMDSWRGGAGVLIVTGTASIDGVMSTYADAPAGTPCALFGSSEHLEIAVSCGNAGSVLALARGSVVTVTKRPSEQVPPGRWHGTA